MTNNDETMNAAGAAENIIANPPMGGGPGEGQETDTQTNKPHIDLEAGIERMRNLLKEVESVAMSALCSQPETACECWRHLGKAVSDIRKAMRPKAGTLAFEDEWAWYGKQMDELRSRMDPKAGSGAFFTNEKVLKEVAELVKPCEKPLDPNAPEMVRGGEPDEKKAIGNFAGVGKVVSYAISRDMTVTVTARTVTGNGDWFFEGIKDGKIVISGSIFGGKWAAAQYCKFLRNGIVSRAKKVWKNHHRRLKEAAIETITPENGGSDGAQPSQGEGAAA